MESEEIRLGIARYGYERTRELLSSRGVESRYSTVFVTSGYPQSKYSLLSIRSSVIVTSINEVSSVQGSRYYSACGQR